MDLPRKGSLGSGNPTGPGSEAVETWPASDEGGCRLLHGAQGQGGERVGPARCSLTRECEDQLRRARRPMPYGPSAVRPACEERGPWKVSIRPIWELVRDAKPQAQRFAHRIGACVLTRSKRFPRKNSGLLILHYAVKLKKKKEKKNLTRSNRDGA